MSEADGMKEIEVQVGDTWVSRPFEALVTGDVFRVIWPPGDNREYVARNMPRVAKPAGNFELEVIARVT